MQGFVDVVGVPLLQVLRGCSQGSPQGTVQLEPELVIALPSRAVWARRAAENSNIVLLVVSQVGSATTFLLSGRRRTRPIADTPGVLPGRLALLPGFVMVGW